MADEVDCVSGSEGVTHKATEDCLTSGDDQVKDIKRRLESWREVLVPLHSFLVWKQYYFPAVLAGVVTLIFILLWYFEPSVCTSLAVTGIIACLLDYAVPIVIVNFFDPAKWTGVQEKKYEEICESIVEAQKQICDLWDSFLQLRDSKPNVYFVSMLTFLLTLAWISSLVNNLFLTFLLALTVVMYPGLKHHGIIDKYVTEGIQQLKTTVGQKLKRN
ncbi:ADP-ribosylation factor-like protein 6-interacting protein 1 [Tachypleus tridentatus]|uniref:ADP-ribosylation factor-like protein 6-interacting protein 1 n=1 Tax=Tachypleus tridentatus TaxID=6853 RepID=UPI003FD274FC